MSNNDFLLTVKESDCGTAIVTLDKPRCNQSHVSPAKFLFRLGSNITLNHKIEISDEIIEKLASMTLEEFDNFFLADWGLAADTS